jgi:hypothetical protein
MNFNKRGQLISTSTRTLYEPSVAARRRIKGSVAAVATTRRTARSTYVAPFRRRTCGRPPAAVPAF